MKRFLTKVEMIKKARLVLTVTMFAIFLISCENETKLLPGTSTDAELKAASAKKGTDPIAKVATDKGFSELLKALSYVDTELETELVDLFSTGKDQHTVFAPTDDAFSNLYSSLGVGTISDIPAEMVLDILLYHVTTGRRASNSVVPKMNKRFIKTLLNESFTVNGDGSIQAIGNTATITAADFSASNGIVHAIDAVMLPFDFEILLHQTRMKIGRALLEVQAPEVPEVLPYYADNIEYHDPIVNVYGIQNMTAFLYQLIIGASPNLCLLYNFDCFVFD